MSTSRRRSARIAAGAAALVVWSPLVTAAQAAPAPKPDQKPGRYIVQLDQAPVATYDGGVGGIAPTRPGKGHKVDAKSPNAKAYQAHLRKAQREARRRAGVPDAAVRDEYTVALNGFSATLTPAQAATLAKAPGVAHVWADEVRHATTVSTPRYLGLTGASGLWARQFGGVDNAGKGIVVGVIDTGIDPGNPSFAPLPGATAPAGFTCDKGDDPTFACNNKVVGARFYGAEYGNDVQYDHTSPRDTNGHGSHTASTAAGDHDVPMAVEGVDMGKGSGMAPAAQIAVYKALWQTAEGRGIGMTAGLVKAIDDATADGVDVINYSISGSTTYAITPDEMAFRAAAEAGVFVAVAGGNSGDSIGVSSVEHQAPWTMTVAASTHDRGARKTITLGDGTTLPGTGLGPGAGPAGLVLAGDIARPGVDRLAASQCRLDADADPANGTTPTLDAAKAGGRIVVCDRGGNDRVDKSRAVKDAGGVGMVLANLDAAQTLNADFHSVPSIHVNAADGATIKAYVGRGGNPTATISAVGKDTVDAPAMADFSSYGPALSSGGDLVKPDISAPGVDVIAAISQDPATGAPRHGVMSGTSMATPHIAGLAALMRQKYPTWSVSAIKSAMMTTARQTTNDGKPIMRLDQQATPLNYGAGEVVPSRAYTPGLVYESGPADWTAWACAIKQLPLALGDEACKGVPTVDPSDLNYPTIAIGALPGTQTVTRTVTNVESRATRYTARVTAPAGTRMTVSPSAMTVPPGQSRTFTVTIERTSAPLGQYAFGQLVWEGNRGQSVQSQVAVRPVALAHEGDARGKGTSGQVRLEVTPGFTGTLSSDVDGLQAATVTPLDVTRADDTVVDGSATFTVPAGTKVTRIATYAGEVNAKDVDLNVFRVAADGSLEQVGSSGNEGSGEEFTGVLAPGTYVAAIDLFSDEAKASVPVNVWNLGEAAAGNLTVTPATQQVVAGRTTSVTASWQGLEAGRHYLGQVNHLQGAEVVGSTLVGVDA